MHKNRAKIGIDARSLLLPSRGIPRYTYNLCVGLPAHRPDWNFTLFVNRGFEHNESPGAYEPRLKRVLEHPNVSLVNYDSSGEMYWEQAILPGLARRSGVQVLHMPANRVCWWTRIPQVVTVHDTIEMKYLRSQMRRVSRSASLGIRAWALRRALYVWTNYKLALRRSAAVVTVSHYSAGDIIRELRLSSRRVTAIHHGVDPEFTPSPLGLAQRSFCLMLGGDSEQKNPDGAIAAWALVPQWLRARYKLIVAGFVGGPESRLMQAIREQRVGESVEVRGWLSEEALVRLFREAAVFLFVSTCEGFGFPVLHAMASGTPLVCSDASSLPEIAGDAAWMAPPDSPDRIAQGICTLLTDEGVWTDYRNRGLARAGQFSWSQSIRKHAEVLESVLAEV